MLTNVEKRDILEKHYNNIIKILENGDCINRDYLEGKTEGIQMAMNLIIDESVPF